MKIRHLLCLCACFLIAASAFAQKSSVDPLIGTWIGDWWPYPDFDFPFSAGQRWDPLLGEKMSRANPDLKKVTVELKWDGEKLTGTVNPGPKAVELQKVTFNAKTGAIRFETDTKDEKGKKKTMTGSWSHENDEGDFKITKK
jgi:hypothetical protein